MPTSISLNELEQQMTEGSSLNNLVYASFYEEESLLLDALTSYETAVRENPEIEDFQTIYNQFVEENDLGSDRDLE